MSLAVNGIAKLIEECGELQQILGKKLAYWTTEIHPDGLPITERIEDEMGDVLAAIWFVCDSLRLDRRRIIGRADHKREVFDGWEADPSNNNDAVRPPSSTHTKDES